MAKFSDAVAPGVKMTSIRRRASEEAGDVGAGLLQQFVGAQAEMMCGAPGANGAFRENLNQRLDNARCAWHRCRRVIHVPQPPVAFLVKSLTIAKRLKLRIHQRS